MSAGPSTASAEARLVSETGKGSQTVTKEETDGASGPPTLRYAVCLFWLISFI